MSKSKTRKLYRRKERRLLNKSLDALRQIGHGARSSWKRFLTKDHLRERP